MIPLGNQPAHLLILKAPSESLQPYHPRSLTPALDHHLWLCESRVKASLTRRGARLVEYCAQLSGGPPSGVALSHTRRPLPQCRLLSTCLSLTADSVVPLPCFVLEDHDLHQEVWFSPVGQASPSLCLEYSVFDLAGGEEPALLRLAPCHATVQEQDVVP